MPDLLAARSQMAMSLGFHILFAMVGIAMPVLMGLPASRPRARPSRSSSPRSGRSGSSLAQYSLPDARPT